jgi:hypothetical protein
MQQPTSFTSTTANVASQPTKVKSANEPARIDLSQLEKQQAELEKRERRLAERERELKNLQPIRELSQLKYK